MTGLPRRSVLAGLAGSLAAACGFEPLYAPGAPASRLAGSVAVPPLDGAAGFALQERLVDRLGPAGPGAYRLAIDFELREAPAAITQDNITTRYPVIGEATYSLLPPGGDAPVLTDAARAQTGYSAPATDVSSAFAARAAALDARKRVAHALADRIVAQLAASAGDWLGPGGGAA